MADTFPTKSIRVPYTKWAFSINPGPFNIKEHALISVFAYAGNDDPYASGIMPIMKVLLHGEVNHLAAFLLIITTQLLGYGLAGFFIKFLVESPYMWWPTNVADVSFFRAFHEVEVKEKGKLTGYQFFILFSILSFAYYIVPNYFFPSLTSLSFVCWIWKDSITAQQLGSGLKGLGLGSFFLDWATLSTFLGSPIIYPLVTIINMGIGFVLLFLIVTPIAYWTNSYNAKRFPFFSSELYDADGQVYNVSRVLDWAFKLDRDEYNNYSKLHLSAFFAYATGFSFAAVTATLSHTALFHGRSIWQQMKDAYGDQERGGDIHVRLVKKNYDPIPQWRFYAILFPTLALGIFSCEGFGGQLQLPFWGVLLGCALAFAFIIPFGVIQATTNMGIQLNIVSDIIIGYLSPGKPLALQAFKSYGMISLSHALSFLSDLKFGVYMKIPPRSLFIAEVMSMVVSSSVNFGVTLWLLSSVDNICDVKKLPKGSPWTCPSYHVGFSVVTIWGIIGPDRVFAPHGVYSNLYHFFVIGAVAPLLVWILMRLFPNKKWIRLINVPVILAVSSFTPPATGMHAWTWLLIGILFNHIIYRKYKGWWAKYAYLLSIALDTGVALMGLLTTVALGLNDIYGIDWWGLALDDHCPLAHCPTAPGIEVDGCPVFH